MTLRIETAPRGTVRASVKLHRTSRSHLTKLIQPHSRDRALAPGGIWSPLLTKLEINFIVFTADPEKAQYKNCVAGLLLDRERNHDDPNSSFMNERKQRADFRVGHRLRSEGARPVFGERVDLELRSGLMAPVHPLGGHLGRYL